MNLGAFGNQVAVWGKKPAMQAAAQVSYLLQGSRNGTSACEVFPYFLGIGNDPCCQAMCHPFRCRKWLSKRES